MKKMWNEELEGKIIVTDNERLAELFVDFLLKERGIRFYNGKTSVKSIFEKKGIFEVAIKNNRIVSPTEKDKKDFEIVDLRTIILINDVREDLSNLSEIEIKTMKAFLEKRTKICVYNNRHSAQLKKELSHLGIIWQSGRSVEHTWYNDYPCALYLNENGRLLKENVNETVLVEDERERKYVSWEEIIDWKVGKK